jgi:hypothetical protein
VGRPGTARRLASHSCGDGHHAHPLRVLLGTYRSHPRSSGRACQRGPAL